MHKPGIMKIVLTLLIVLVIIYIGLSVVTRDTEYKAEQIFYRVVKSIDKIAMNPDVIPPGLYGSVEKDINIILKKYPKTNMAKVAKFTLAEFYNASKKYDKATVILDSIIKTESADQVMLSRAYFLKGNIYEKQNKWQSALNEYTTLKTKYENTQIGFEIPIYIARHYENIGNDAETSAAYTEAVNFYISKEKENRKSIIGYTASNLLIQAYVGLKRYEDAGQTIENTMNNYPSPIVYAQQLSNIEFIYVKMLKNTEKAIALYKAIEEKITDPEFKNFLTKKIALLQRK